MKLVAAPFLFLIFAISAGPLFAQQEGVSRSKCGFPAVTEKIEQAQKNPLLQQRMAEPPVLETSIVSPSGHFRIHFDTSRGSTDRPALLDASYRRIEGTHYQYADSVAQIFDHVWDVEIGTLGFPAPPSDNGDGGGNEYDIYIHSMTDFGLTDFPGPGTVYPGEVAPRYASYISIDCDFGIGFRTKGLAAVRVTAAHEFFHAIQVGGYGWWDTPERYFYELTAESMESAVYPEVKDYIHDAPSYFSSINQTSFTQNDPSDFGYGRTVWGIYFRLKYGIEFIRAVWEKVSLQRPPLALLKTVEQYGSTMRKEFSEFALWCYYTNTRADSVHFFPDAKLLPGVHLADSVRLTTPSYALSRTCPSYTIQYVWLQLASDTAVCVVINANSDDANAHAGGVFLFTLNAGQQSGSDWKQLSASMNFRLTVSDPAQWNAFALSNGTWMPLANTHPFPDPFHPGIGQVSFPLPPSVGAPVQVTILDGAMHLVNQWDAPPQSQMGIWQVLWDGRDFRRSLVSSGIYFYFIRSNNYQQQGKIAVLR